MKQAWCPGKSSALSWGHANLCRAASLLKPVHELVPLPQRALLHTPPASSPPLPSTDPSEAPWPSWCTCTGSLTSALHTPRWCRTRRRSPPGLCLHTRNGVRVTGRARKCCWTYPGGTVRETAGNSVPGSETTVHCVRCVSDHRWTLLSEKKISKAEMIHESF